ncbi:hypothetical protein WOLCODRAFT_167866 [Wolfiporia cocos MD-104 SS10]|uniref:Uncharacterized protein n=1 Tax=Wolfiporia cocos (strain MD-104) TaxID=742152 RepID=A0A2H3JRG8_WOLCO|nr:hypothetical protein WOLCODRAFT_167866 [Wolfiporia cocos MD-104 SS10]
MPDIAKLDGIASGSVLACVRRAVMPDTLLQRAPLTRSSDALLNALLNTLLNALLNTLLNALPNAPPPPRTQPAPRKQYLGMKTAHPRASGGHSICLPEVRTFQPVCALAAPSPFQPQLPSGAASAAPGPAFDGVYAESNESHEQQLENTMQHGRARDATHPPDDALRIDLHHSRTFLGHRLIFFLLLSRTNG